MKFSKYFFILLIIHIFYSVHCNAQDDIVADVPSEVSYTVKFTGFDNEDLRNQLREYSRTVELTNRPPVSAEYLRRRANDDIDRLRNVLHSQGYFGATLDATVDAATQPAIVTFQVNPGSLYQLKAINIEQVQDATQPIELPSNATLGLELNKTVRTDEILDAQTRIVNYFEDRSYPFAEVTNQRVLVNHEEKSVRVTYTINIGPKAFFGDTDILGLEDLEENYVRNRIIWNRGEAYDADLVAKTQLKLIRTNLFSLVQIRHATFVTADNNLPMTIELTERKPRTISAGAFYNTDDGPGARIGWEHRNLFGGGETLSTELTASLIEYLGYVEYRKPDFLDVDQFLVLRAEVGYDQPDAYESRNQTTSAIIERIINEDMTISGGISYRLADVTQLDTRETYGLFSLPAEFYWDFSNNLLNPTSGGRLDVISEPFYDTLGNSDMFWRNYFKYSHYYKLTDSPSIILAGRLGLGSIVGDTLFDIPADERYYAGGSNSIRGYPYKTVSPLVRGHPVGGLSLIEMSFEVRWNFTETMGVVGFIDGGNAFESNFPDFSEELQWGVGTGFRYFTPIGPLRVDVGFPVNGRDNLDDSFELYISIGQAF